MASEDPFTWPTAPGLHWATSNLGEAMPGVQTPLSFSLWADGVEHAPREAAFQIGGLTRRERRVPEPGERYVRIFYGRPAIQVEFFALLGDRMPGTTGEETAISVLGRAPDDIEYRPTLRRVPVIAWRLPLAHARTPARLRTNARDWDAWHVGAVARAARLDRREATALLTVAERRLDAALTSQTIGILSVMQPLHDAVVRLCAAAGAGDASVLTGASGGAEMAVVADIWAASRGRLSVAEVVRRHGFHGPAEGEASSRVWREDDAPLRAMIAGYAARPDSDDPILRERERRAARPAAERELLAAVPRWQRPAVAGLLRLARERLPLRGVGKRGMVQSLDVGRAAARRLGALLAADGVLDEPDDVFYLTLAECQALPRDARSLVAARRARRREYQAMVLPNAWTGMVEPLVPETEEVDAVEGIGVSAGVVEGAARVLVDPDFDDVEDGEVLVAPFTDPSWASIMFLSSALVVDIGGALSHAAVVAREMGVPCVVNTRTGTRDIRTGDRVRVDGRTGIVEILERSV